MIDLRPPCPISRFPAPQRLEAGPMPSQYGFQLHHLGHTEQTRPEFGYQYEQGAVAAAQSNTRSCSPQRDVELMTQKQILGLEPVPRLEQVNDEKPEREQDRNHRSKMR